MQGQLELAWQRALACDTKGTGIVSKDSGITSDYRVPAEQRNLPKWMFSLQKGRKYLGLLKLTQAKYPNA